MPRSSLPPRPADSPRPAVFPRPAVSPRPADSPRSAASPRPAVSARPAPAPSPAAAFPTPTRVLIAAAVLAVVGALTLAPRALARPLRAAGFDAMDVLPVEVMDALFVAGAETTLNVALFVPVGMAVAALLPLRWAWLAAGFGAVLSIVIETAQAAIPGRVPDVDDVLANTAGAILGTAVVILVRLVARTAAALSRSRG